MTTSSGRSVQQKKHLHDLEVLLEKCFEKPTIGKKALSPIRKVVASKEETSRKVIASTPIHINNGREVITAKVVQAKPSISESTAYRVKQGEVPTTSAKTVIQTKQGASVEEEVKTYTQSFKTPKEETAKPKVESMFSERKVLESKTKETTAGRPDEFEVHQTRRGKQTKKAQDSEDSDDV